MAAERNPVQWLNNFALGFAGQRPVFHNGVQIGYFKNLDDLCKGVIQIYPQFRGNTKYSEWLTKDDMWRDVPVNAYCTSAGVKPTWLSAVEYQTLQKDLPAVSQPFKLPSLTGAAKANIVPIAIAASAGVLALVLILRRR